MVVQFWTRRKPLPGNSKDKIIMSTTHTLFLRFSCGHDFFTKRCFGGSDWENCLCESCQPYHGVLTVEHPCSHCGDSLAYLKDAPQIRLSETQARQRMTGAVALYQRLSESKASACQSSKIQRSE